MYLIYMFKHFSGYSYLYNLIIFLNIWIMFNFDLKFYLLYIAFSLKFVNSTYLYILLNTYGFHWNRMGILRVWNNWDVLSSKWPNCGWGYFCHQYPFCTLSQRERICSYRSLCIRRPFRGRRRTRIGRCRRSPQSPVLEKNKINDVIMIEVRL